MGVLHVFSVSSVMHEKTSNTNTPGCFDMQFLGESMDNMELMVDLISDREVMSISLPTQSSFLVRTRNLV